MPVFFVDYWEVRENSRLVCEDVVSLILGFTVQGDPHPASVRLLLEQCADYLQTMVVCKLNQPVTLLVPFFQVILSCALFHGLSQSGWCIEVSHDYVVVSSAVGENLGNVFVYLLCLLIRVTTSGYVDLDALELVPLVYSDVYLCYFVWLTSEALNISCYGFVDHKPNSMLTYVAV